MFVLLYNTNVSTYLALCVDKILMLKALVAFVVNNARLSILPSTPNEVAYALR